MQEKVGFSRQSSLRILFKTTSLSIALSQNWEAQNETTQKFYLSSKKCPILNLYKNKEIRLGHSFCRKCKCNIKPNFVPVFIGWLNGFCKKIKKNFSKTLLDETVIHSSFVSQWFASIFRKCWKFLKRWEILLCFVIFWIFFLDLFNTWQIVMW